ncbi:hypothetical protein GALMADRAFT_719615 [Galerina marginata CBS 339.88]|uniref:Uncharacterized protein n=1 Tax=Galerina marginata (strain CBS 339.88) TaxID=685588 RepID=A0A067TQM2_GALM3|nr:hypothetical protein GALMADRAFT_719615 [Galerina marginata CBS 339.88]
MRPLLYMSLYLSQQRPHSYSGLTLGFHSRPHLTSRPPASRSVCLHHFFYYYRHYVRRTTRSHQGRTYHKNSLESEAYVDALIAVTIRATKSDAVRRLPTMCKLPVNLYEDDRSVSSSLTRTRTRMEWLECGVEVQAGSRR